MEKFEDRFRRFVASRPDSKILDDGKRNPEGGIADFLLNHDSIIAELKCLEKDVIEKLQAFATKIMEDRKLLVYGAVPFSKIVETQPDREELKREAILKIGTSIERHFKKANDQIKNTKSKLNLMESSGLLILANTDNPTVEPDVAMWLLWLLFNRRKEDGSPICSAIQCVLYLTELHTAGDLDGTKLRPLISFFRDKGPRYEPLSKYLDVFLEDWAAFNRTALFITDEPYKLGKDFSQTPMRRGGLMRQLKEEPPRPFIAATFPLPALCPHCGSRFAHPADRKNSMYVNEPQKDLLVVGFVCPRCDDIAATHIADLAVDRQGDIIRTHPWTRPIEDLLAPNWRDFIVRRDTPDFSIS